MPIPSRATLFPATNAARNWKSSQAVSRRVISAVQPNPLYLISKSHSFDKVSLKFVILTVGLFLEMKSF
jgi:hypothetical protein